MDIPEEGVTVFQVVLLLSAMVISDLFPRCRAKVDVPEEGVTVFQVG